VSAAPSTTPGPTALVEPYQNFVDFRSKSKRHAASKTGPTSPVWEESCASGTGEGGFGAGSRRIHPAA
jgi:hypothetical protein